MFQKKYTDEKGIKYFLNAKIYDFTFTTQMPENYVIEFEGQFYKSSTHNAVDFIFIDWGFYDVESWLENLFNNGFIEHYELY